MVATLFAFIDAHPDAMVYVSGSTPSRTRLYRMGITKYVDEIKERFDLYGQKGEDWEVFQKSVEYEAFIIQLKD